MACVRSPGGHCSRTVRARHGLEADTSSWARARGTALSRKAERAAAGLPRCRRGRGGLRGLGPPSRDSAPVWPVARHRSAPPATGQYAPRLVGRAGDAATVRTRRTAAPAGQGPPPGRPVLPRECQVGRAASRVLTAARPSTVLGTRNHQPTDLTHHRARAGHSGHARATPCCGEASRLVSATEPSADSRPLPPNGQPVLHRTGWPFGETGEERCAPCRATVVGTPPVQAGSLSRTNGTRTGRRGH